MKVTILDNYRPYKISVCIATYNGEKYISEQLESIISQLMPEDEIIVSDDGSSDNTLKIVESYINIFPNIKIVMGPQMGFSSNFGNALKYANNEIIFFSDQDDIWPEKKVSDVLNCFKNNPNADVVLHDLYTFNENILEDTNQICITYKKGVFNNFVKSCYWGCCMAVKRDFIIPFLPLRDFCVGHDQLTGLLSEKYGYTVFLNKKLLWHRLHTNNTSGRRTFRQMVVFRFKLLRDFIYAIKIYRRRK